MSPDDLFDAIADELAPHGATAGLFFGKRALKVDGKAFLCLKGDVLACRLGKNTPSHGHALALSEAALFEPCEGRTFKVWVAVPFTHGDWWQEFAEDALVHLCG